MKIEENKKIWKNEQEKEEKSYYVAAYICIYLCLDIGGFKFSFSVYYNHSIRKETFKKNLKKNLIT